ncbi:MAG: hypothetical protein ABIO70_00820 [Pseudomonadota bacterium]
MKTLFPALVLGAALSACDGPGEDSAFDDADGDGLSDAEDA